jgi:hypothetical protein
MENFANHCLVFPTHTSVTPSAEGDKHTEGVDGAAITSQSASG